MKLLSLLILLIFTFITIDAQQPFVMKQSDLLKYFKEKKSRPFKMPKDSVILNEMSAYNSTKAKLLYETEKGKVYELPLDKMRCLVPEIRSNMPVYKAFPQGFIPNSIPKTDVISITPDK